MPTYLYKARTKKGELKKGEITAIDEESAATLLKEHDLTLTELVPAEKATPWEKLSAALQRIKAKDKVVLTRQLATMIKSGLPIVQALKILADQTTNQKLKDILTEITSEVEGGTSLSESMSRFPEAFSKVYIAMIRSGEASGNLDDVLVRLADQMEKDYETTSKIKSALLYPGFIFGALILAGAVMMIFVVPQLEGLFKESGVSLPWTTKLLILVSNILSNDWWLILIALLGVIFLTRSIIQTEEGRKIWDRIKLSLPIIGPILKKIYMSRFARTLGTLTGGGIHILEALEITGEAIGNTIYQQGLQEARDQVENGIALAIPLRANENFPPMVSQMVSVGEQTGKIDEILIKLANFFEGEIDAATKGLTSLIEPILIVIMGAGVGILIASIIMPIYNLAQVIG